MAMQCGEILSTLPSIYYLPVWVELFIMKEENILILKFVLYLSYFTIPKNALLFPMSK